MATKYARATGNWTTDATWSTTSGGPADTTKPTAADDAVLDAASGAINVTIDSGAVCRSLDCNGYTGTLTHTASVNLAIGDGTAGTGNRALRLAAGMTYTLNASASVSFKSTSATVQTVTTAGKNMPYTDFSGAAGSWQLADALTVTGTTLALTQGTLDTNGQTVVAPIFNISNSNTRTLTLGSSAITLSSTGTAWSAGTVTNLTVTANTATVTLTGTAATWASGNINWNGLSVVLSGAGTQVINPGASVTIANLTRTGTALKGDGLSLTAGITCTGTFTATGNSAVNRLLVASNTLGTARTISAAAVSLTNVDFRDITAAGAATWTGTSIGNALGNTGITFTTPVTVTHNAGAAGNWSTAANWDTGLVPLCHDTVVIPATTTGTLTADMPRLGADISFANGFTGTFNSTATTEVYGSWTNGTGMTNSAANQFSFMGRSSHTITSAGKTTAWTVRISSIGGTYTAADAFTCSATGQAWGTVSGMTGTYNDGGFAHTWTGSSAFVALASSTGIWTSSGTWTIASTTAVTPWTGLGTVNHTGTIVLSGATATDRTFAGGGKTYGTLTDQNTSTGKLTITGANTFGTLSKTAAAACTLALPTSSGITVTNSFNVNGILGALLTLTGDVTKASGNVICSYLNISSSDAAGGATFYAGRTSTDGGGNTGWLFVDYVTGTATGSGTGDGTAVGTRIVLGTATGDGTGDGTATGLRTVLGVAEGSGTGDGTATGLRLVYGTATGSGEGSGLAIGGQVDPEGGLCGYWLHSDDLRPNGCTPCKSVTAESPSDDILNEAILAASEYLNAAVQFQFPGICENTVRPCGGEEGFGFGAGLFAWSQIPFYFPPGVFPLWWAGCGCAGACNCCGPPAFSLGKIPIVAVSEVKLDGEILEPEVDYTVVGDLLARLDPDGSGNDTWPACQNIALPDTEEGTFSVTFTWGAMPPSLGLAAARDLACLLVADACGEDCKPSERMVTRQAGGTTVQLISPDGDIRTSMPRTVKLFIDAFGPPKPSMRTFPKIRRPNSGTGVIVGPVDYGLGWQRGGWGAGCAGCG